MKDEEPDEERLPPAPFTGWTQDDFLSLYLQIGLVFIGLVDQISKEKVKDAQTTG